MAEKIEMFKAADGGVHETEQAADWHSAAFRVKTALEACTGSDGEIYMDSLIRALERNELRIVDIDKLANEKKPSEAILYLRSR